MTKALQVMFLLASWLWTLRLKDFFGRPLLLNPRGFHWWALRVMLFSCRGGVCLIHFNFLLLILRSLRLCHVLSHSCSFEITSRVMGYLEFSINKCFYAGLQLLVNIIIDLHDSQPCRRTDFTFVSEIVSFVRDLIQFFFHTEALTMFSK